MISVNPMSKIKAVDTNDRTPAKHNIKKMIDRLENIFPKRTQNERNSNFALEVVFEVSIFPPKIILLILYYHIH